MAEQIFQRVIVRVLLFLALCLGLGAGAVWLVVAYFKAGGMQ